MMKYYIKPENVDDLHIDQFVDQMLLSFNIEISQEQATLNQKINTLNDSSISTLDNILSFQQKNKPLDFWDYGSNYQSLKCAKSNL